MKRLHHLPDAMLECQRKIIADLQISNAGLEHDIEVITQKIAAKKNAHEHSVAVG